MASSPAGRPVVVSADADSEIVSIVEEAPADSWLPVGRPRRRRDP
jgi:hypothetical protein